MLTHVALPFCAAAFACSRTSRSRFVQHVLFLRHHSLTSRRARLRRSPRAIGAQTKICTASTANENSPSPQSGREEYFIPPSHTTVRAVRHTAVRLSIPYCFNASTLSSLTYDFLHFASYTFRLLCISVLSRTSFIFDIEPFSPSQICIWYYGLC